MVAVHLAQFVCACCGCCAPMGCEPRLLRARPGGHHAVALRLWVLIPARCSFAETHVLRSLLAGVTWLLCAGLPGCCLARLLCAGWLPGVWVL